MFHQSILYATPHLVLVDIISAGLNNLPQMSRNLMSPCRGHVCCQHEGRHPLVLLHSGFNCVESHFDYMTLFEMFRSTKACYCSFFGTAPRANRIYGAPRGASPGCGVVAAQTASWNPARPWADRRFRAATSTSDGRRLTG